MPWNPINKLREMKKKRSKASDIKAGRDKKATSDGPHNKSPGSGREGSDDTMSPSYTATSISDRVPDKFSVKERGKMRISPAVHASTNPSAPSNQRRQRRTTSDNQTGNKVKEQAILTKKGGKRTPDKKRTRDVEEAVIRSDGNSNDLTSKKVSTRKKNRQKKSENISEDQKLVTQQCSEDEGNKPKKQVAEAPVKKPAKKSNKKSVDQPPLVDANNETPLKKQGIPKKKLPAKEVPLASKPDVHKATPSKDEKEEKEDTTDLRSFNWLLSPPREKPNAANPNQNPKNK